jgi:putative ABC transport system permease protein
MLERKLVRDLWRLKGQVATISLVLACGIMAMIMLRDTWQSLLAARDAYYASYRFGDVFAHLERAPDAVAARLQEIPGVARVYPRVVEDIMVPLPDEPDPVTGRIVSIPDDGVPPLNGLYLSAGRLPVAGAADEAVVLEQFAVAHELRPGDRVPAVIEGRLRQLRVVGIALSPEYVLAMSSTAPVADNRRFVVLWMLRSTIAPAFRMEGAFDDVVLQLEPRASEVSVLDAVDSELARYGGRHAQPRDKQQSNYTLTQELSILQNLALVIPAVFLAVAAFLVNVVVSRLVFLDRAQIAVLKALGFSNRRVGVHYLALVALIVTVAAALGVSLGVWSGRWMTNLYASFYRFPTSVFHVAPSVVAITIGISLGAATVGALGAVVRVTRMPPAQAMRPPSPLSYRRSLVDRLGIGRLVGASGTMVVREIQRRPVRTLMSIAGIAMGVGIFVMGRFSWDSFDHLFDNAFVREHQEDMTVLLSHPRPERAVRELAHLPGVRVAEPQHALPVRLHAGTHSRDTAIFALPVNGQLRHLLDHGTTPIELPDDGVVMTDKLAEILGVAVGDPVEVDVLEGDWATRTLVVRALIDEPFGLQAYARADWLARWLGEEPQVSSVLLGIDSDRLDDVRARLKELPYVVGVTSTQNIIDRYRQQTGESMWVITAILTLSAAAIAIGVVYNNARIALSMRSRDLATLRVLGFTRREISAVLLGELAVQVVVGIPLGLVLGNAWAHLFSFDSEAIRFPLHIALRTYAAAATIAAVSGVVSALLVRRKLDRLDLVEVLKSSSE